MPLKIAPRWIGKSRGSSRQLDAVSQQEVVSGAWTLLSKWVMTSCLLSQEEQSHNAGKAESRKGWWSALLRGEKWFHRSRGWEKGECWKWEGGNSWIQTHCCQCINSQLICTPQEKTGRGRRGRSGSLRIFWPSLYLAMSVPTPQSGSGQCLLQPHKSNILLGRCRAVKKLPALGNWIITVIKLVLSCQAGTGLATKSWLFHDPDSSDHGNSGGVALAKPSFVLW